MEKMNYALLIDCRKKYPVTYLASHQSRTKIREIGDYMLMGGDLTENQIKELHRKGLV